MKLAEIFDRVSGGDTGIEFRAYDGSRSGPLGSPNRVDVRSPRAISYLLQSRADLGLARAYVSGDLEIHGDLFEVLRRLWRNVDGTVSWRGRWEILRSLERRNFRPVAPPPSELRLRGRRHSKRRDAAAVSHHYDVSNRFYECVLGPSMAYTCAVYPHFEATLEEAQFEKFDLVCRKLGLRPGMRLLDVGCGWGGMVLHAAEHYGVQATGVTLSRAQADWGQRAIAEAGLSERAEVRFLDYRSVVEGGFDAIASIGLTEHVGKDQGRRTWVGSRGRCGGSRSTPSSTRATATTCPSPPRAASSVACARQAAMCGRPCGRDTTPGDSGMPTCPSCCASPTAGSARCRVVEARGRRAPGPANGPVSEGHHERGKGRTVVAVARATAGGSRRSPSTPPAKPVCKWGRRRYPLTGRRESTGTYRTSRPPSGAPERGPCR